LRFDFTFSDDQGRQAYANVKIIVKPSEAKPSFALVYAISASSFLALILIHSYFFLYSKDITRQPDVNRLAVTKYMLNAKARFGEYLQVDVRYKERDKLHGPALTWNQPNTNFSAVLTTDFDFQQPDPLFAGNEVDQQHRQSVDSLPSKRNQMHIKSAP
jgi:hypothetical protein